MQLDYIIIEDEPLAMKKLEGYIEKVPFLQLAGRFNLAADAIGFIKMRKPHLLFLDIEMAGMTGIELLESLREKPRVIITTAYAEHALKGFELQVCDYLLKPVKFDRFVKACEKVYDEIVQVAGNNRDYIFVKTEYRLEKIHTVDILYIEGMRDYRYIITTGKKVMTLQTFGELAHMLSPSLFVRVHQSYLVSIGKIDSIERNRIRIGAKYIPISDSRKKDFYRAIGK